MEPTPPSAPTLLSLDIEIDRHDRLKLHETIWAGSFVSSPEFDLRTAVSIRSSPRGATWIWQAGSRRMHAQ